jgi:hypothetical protein
VEVAGRGAGQFGVWVGDAGNVIVPFDPAGRAAAALFHPDLDLRTRRRRPGGC